MVAEMKLIERALNKIDGAQIFTRKFPYHCSKVYIRDIETALSL